MPEVHFKELNFLQQLLILKEVAGLFKESSDPHIADEIIFMIESIELPEVLTSGEITGVA